MVNFLVFTVIFILPWVANGYSDLVTARSYILIEKDSMEIIEGKYIERKLPPASTTKVVTSLIALEKLSGEEMIRPSKGVLSIPPSKMGIKPNKKYKAIDLIKGMLIKSANDAAYTLACYIAGSEEKFAQMMNQFVHQLGATNTNFRNASGLYDPYQYTTCYDLALIFRYALDSDRFRQILSIKYFDFKDGKKLIRFQNHNRFLFCFDPAIGGKTGFTKASRHSYVGAFQKDGRTYILAILGSEDLWGDALWLLRNVFDTVPNEEEIQSAKAKDIILASYKEKKGSIKGHKKRGSISKLKRKT
ncbi:MAG: D-alanyl-D-alanine carboxypeptidase [Deltaproteobacteria bacterium]|nr:D-alanyl-D-alanine carboxypeptidase [Deltaproteobacteria bacterium]